MAGFDIKETLKKIEKGTYPTREYPEEKKPTIEKLSELKTIECKNCGTIIKTHIDTPYENLTCCKYPNLILLSTEGNDGDIPQQIISVTDRQEIEKSDVMKLKMTFLSLIKDKNISRATERLVYYVLSNNKIYTTLSDLKPEMWIYREGIYIPEGKSHVRKVLRNILQEWYCNYYANLVIAKIETDTSIDADEFFLSSNKEEVAVQNGILNITTKELSNFSDEKIFFNKIPVNYIPDSECEKIDKFLGEVLSNEEDKNIFYELGGFALLKDYRYEKAFMFHGGGRNGKGKTIDLLRRTVGIKNCAGIPLTALTSDSFQISELFGKYLNLAGDLSSTDLKDTGMFKSLTGRDLISGKRKFLKDISFENHAKFVFACNDLPMVYDLSKGFWERWILLDFPYYFADKDLYDKTPEKDRINWKVKDNDILNKITTPGELSGLLNRFLEGLDRLLLNNKFSSAKGSDEIKNTWIRKANSFIAFCMDKIEEDFEENISKKNLRKKYNQYCKLHKTGGKSDKMIKSVLQEMFGVNEERINQNQGGLYDSDWCWVGIKWKGDKK